MARVRKMVVGLGPIGPLKINGRRIAQVGGGSLFPLIYKKQYFSLLKEKK